MDREVLQGLHLHVRHGRSCWYNLVSPIIMGNPLYDFQGDHDDRSWLQLPGPLRLFPGNGIHSVLAGGSTATDHQQLPK